MTIPEINFDTYLFRYYRIIGELCPRALATRQPLR